MDPSELPQLAHPLPGQIAWVCDTCGSPMRAGALHIDLAQVTAARRERADWEKRKQDAEQVWALELLLLPDIPRWRVECNACCHDCAGCYSIDLAQCQSMFALVRWTAHLYEKTWFGATNWINFIRKVAQENGSPLEATGVW